MANPRPFGRRATAQPQSPGPRRAVKAAATPARAAFEEQPVEPRVPVPVQSDAPSLDRELQEWKKARKQGGAMPWRQLSLMASLCFGLASFVLPDAVNDVVQWPLYALMAASFYAGVSRRRRQAAR